MSERVGVPQRQGSAFLGMVPLLLDLVVPIAAYYVLTGVVGLTPFWALVIGGGLTAVVALVNTVRRGKLDSFGVLVILEIVLGLVLDLTVQDPRLTLARSSLSIALAGFWILGSTFTHRPITVDITRTFAAKKGGAEGVAAFEWLADHSRPFLQIQRWLSGVWCVMFLIYAVARVFVIYAVPLAEGVWLNEVPGIIAVVICLAASARAGKKLETMVNDRMAQAAGQVV